MITINGQTGFAASAKRARNAMLMQDQLARFLPPGSTISKAADDSFDFVVVKDIGVTTIKLAGILTVSPMEDPNALHFVANAKHIIGGSAVIDLVIRFEGTDAQCAMTYDGSVDAAGLVGKFLSLGETKLQSRLDAMFSDFGHRLARTQRGVPAKAPNQMV